MLANGALFVKGPADGLGGAADCAGACWVGGLSAVRGHGRNGGEEVEGEEVRGEDGNVLVNADPMAPSFEKTGCVVRGAN